MKNQTEQVLGVLRNLDEFVGDMELPRQIHVRWQMLYKSVENKVREILHQEERKKEKKEKKASDA